MTAFAIVHFDEDGNMSFSHTPDVVLLCVDERCPDDRVYCANNVVSPFEIQEIVGKSKIGHLNDGSGNTERVRRIMGDSDA